MAKVPRYQAFQTNTAAGAQISLETAAAPAKAVARSGARLAAEANEFLRQKKEAARAIEVADRLTGAVQAFEDWMLEQSPYDEQGRPTFDRLTQEADKAWGKIVEDALSDLQDSKAAQQLELRLKDYYGRRRLNVSAQAHRWEIEHRRGQLEGSLNKLSDLAARADSMDLVERYLADAQQALTAAASSGVISPEEYARLDREFSGKMLEGYVRTQIYAGNWTEAAASLRSMRERGLVAERSYRTLARELTSEYERAQKRAEEGRQQVLNALAIDLLRRAAAGENVVAEVDRLAEKGLFGRFSTYQTLRDAVSRQQAGRDDPQAVKWFMDRFARGQATLEDLAHVRDKVTPERFQSFATLMRNSSNAKSMFNDPVFREARQYVESRLRQQGRLASRLSYVEQVMIPRALFEITMYAQSKWEGQLDYVDMINFAEDLVLRYETSIHGRGADYSVRYAPPPRYKSPDEARQAYEKGELGLPGSEQAKRYLEEELRAIRRWEQRKALSRARTQAQAEEKVRGFEGVLP